MTNAKHTPGPWYVENRKDTIDAVVVMEADGRHVATVYTPDGTHHSEARLIASAPDLLAALKAIVESEWMVSHDWGGDRDSVIVAARAAINKAEGK